MITGIEAGPIHNGGRLAFGPDGKLYVTTGETGDPQLAQEDGLNGKVLRTERLPLRRRHAGGVHHRATATSRASTGSRAPTAP